MKAVDILLTEHALIRKYLDGMAAALEKLEKGETIPLQYFEQINFFYQRFVDGYHHFKEEHQMFRMLAQKAGGSLDGRIDSLRQQHENGRTHMAAILKAAEGYVTGDEKMAVDLVEHIAAYISMLRRHIHIEDMVVYPMVEETFTEADHVALDKQFKDANEKAGAGFMDEYTDRLAQMEALLARG